MKNRNLLNILLIEDNPADAHLVKIFLKETKMKHEFHHVESLYEGNDFLESNTAHLVLLDLSLPDSTGFKTLTSFMEKNASVPVVVMTGLNDDIVGNQAVKAGAQDYLIKGEFDSRLLGRVVRYSMQRHKTQKALEETARSLSISERRYIEAQEMANFGNFEMDLVTNEMSWTNEVYRILGFLPGSIRPTLKDYLNCVHFDERDRVEEFFEEAAKDGQRHKLEHKIIINGRTIHYVLIHAKVYYDEISSKFLLVGGIQDITERKLGEQLIIEKNLSTQTSKIKEEILQDMSFHIRTPLSSILNLSYILSNTEMGGTEKELMKGLKASVDDLSISVNNLLNFSMLVSEKVNIEEEEIMLEDFMQRTKQLVQMKAGQKKIDLKFNSDISMPKHFKTDKNKLSQVLYNIIDNGIKYSSENSKVNIDFGMSNIQNDQYDLVVKVQDQGVGLMKTQIENLLVADNLLQVNYEDGDNKQLGMAIVNKLVKSLEGQLAIESELGKGATFTVTIPVKTVRKEMIGIDDKPNQALKILLVEDHFLNQIATRKVLTSWSDFVTVDIAENGLIGYEKFKEHGYDLILMDIQMPVMDGFESTTKIREVSPVPIIALTANSSKQEAAKCLEIGMNEYMSKPIKPDDLYTKIMTVLSKSYVS